MWVHKPREKVGDHIEAIIGAAIILSDTQFAEVTQAKWDVRWGLHLGEDPLIDAGIRLLLLSAAVWALNVRCGDIDWRDPMSVLNRGLQDREAGPTWEGWVAWRCTKVFKKKQSAEHVLRERDRQDKKRKKREEKNGVKRKRKRNRRRREEETTGTSSTAQ